MTLRLLFLKLFHLFLFTKQDKQKDVTQLNTRQSRTHGIGSLYPSTSFSIIWGSIITEEET